MTLSTLRFLASIAAAIAVSSFATVVSAQDAALERTRRRLMAAIERAPDDAPARCELGFVEYRRGDLEAAARILDEAIPLADAAHRALAEGGIRHRRRAQRTLRACLHSRGRVHERGGELTAAAESYARAAALGGDRAEHVHAAWIGTLAIAMSAPCRDQPTLDTRRILDALRIKDHPRLRACFDELEADAAARGRPTCQSGVSIPASEIAATDAASGVSFTTDAHLVRSEAGAMRRCAIGWGVRLPPSHTIQPLGSTGLLVVELLHEDGRVIDECSRYTADGAIAIVDAGSLRPLALLRWSSDENECAPDDGRSNRVSVTVDASGVIEIAREGESEVERVILRDGLLVGVPSSR